MTLVPFTSALLFLKYSKKIDNEYSTMKSVNYQSLINSLLKSFQKFGYDLLTTSGCSIVTEVIIAAGAKAIAMR